MDCHSFLRQSWLSVRTGENLVDSEEIAWFDHKVRSRGQEVGIFVAANGITGDVHSLRFAHSIISYALEQKRHLIVLTRADIEHLNSPNEMVELLRDKELLLVSDGTSIVA